MAESKFSHIFARVGRPVFTVEHKKQTVISINSAGEELTGFAAKDVVGKAWRQLFDEASVRRIDALMQILENNKDQDGGRELQLMMKRKTGRQVQVNLTLSLLEDGDDLVGIFDLEDLTPILNLQHEKEMLRAEMSRVSKLADIGRLTGGIAHELNNPLAILQGLCENLFDLIESNVWTKDKVMVELVPMQDTIHRMTRIIHSMMSVARGEEPIMETMTVSDLWERATASFQALDQLKGISLKADLDPELRISVDSIRVEQIFVNIVKNAIHALQVNPTGQREIRVSAEAQKEQVQIHVDNNGPPINENIAENIYTPFFTTKPVGEGFGLGLFLAYSVMKAHGGTLSHSNLKPKGVRFTLTFPRRHRSAIPESKKRVLIVDDEPLFRQMLGRKLESLGYQATVARDAGEVLEELHKAKPYDILITDHRMPGVDGAHLVVDVRKFSQIPIIFVTGYDEDILLRLLDKGVIQGIVPKPFEDEILINALNTALKHKNANVAKVG